MCRLTTSFPVCCFLLQCNISQHQYRCNPYSEPMLAKHFSNWIMVFWCHIIRDVLISVHRYLYLSYACCWDLRCCCPFQLLVLLVVITSSQPSRSASPLQLCRSCGYMLSPTILGNYISCVQGCDVILGAAVFILISSFLTPTHDLTECRVII